MGAIFISYRRDDSEGHAGRLYNDLVRQFGNRSVFMDVFGVEPGLDYRNVIDNSVSSCGVLLAVIGPGWLDAKDESGHRRLDNPMDFVRLETAAALKRGIPVVPVLVHGARMPKSEQLPEDLIELAYRNALELTHARWDSDLNLLIKSLKRHVSDEDSRSVDASGESQALGAPVDASESAPPRTLPSVASKPSHQSRRVILGGIAGALLVAIVVGILSYMQRDSPPIIKMFSVFPNEVTKGGKVAIKWEVANADDVELEPFGQATAAGNAIDDPRSDTIYKLSATNKGGGKNGAFQKVIVDEPDSPKVEHNPQEEPSRAPASTSPPTSRLDSPIPNFAGIWTEINPKDSAHPLRLKIVQTGAQIALYISYNQGFGQKAFFATAIGQGRATTSIPQSCATTFQHPGYNYDNPGVNIFNISLRGSSLVYEQDTKWTSPCDGHQIGLEKNTRELQHVSQ